MITFAVSDVQPFRRLDSLDADASLRSFLARPIEGLHCAASNLVYCGEVHAFAQAAHEAFYLHHPLVIRPDDVWFCIAQGFARHVKQNSESLRDRLVAHEGRLTLVVGRPDFVLGRPNPWPEAFAAFASQIAEHAGAARELVGARFSTTTPVEAAAFDVCLMDGFQGFFTYEMRIGCGIPQITLMGTPQDWHSMIERTRAFADYGLGEWIAALHPVLRKIADTSAGHIDIEFWHSFFRYESGSGPAELTGWILTLFPYLLTHRSEGALEPNPYLPQWLARFEAAQSRGHLRFHDAPEGPGIQSLPGSMASAPLICQTEGVESPVKLLFVAGQFGVNQDPASGALSPAFGWSVVHDVPPPEPRDPWDDGGVDEVTGLTRRP